MEPKGIVAASEYATTPWKKRDEPLDDLVHVLAHYDGGIEMITSKLDGRFFGETENSKVMFWMHIPPLPRGVDHES